MMPLFDYFRGPNPARRRSGIFGGDLTGVDSGEATSLALLNAMGPMQEAGFERSAGPAGAIAKNLIPLFGAIIQGKAMEKQAQLQDLMLQMKMAQMAGDPEKRAAEIEHLRSLAASEQSLAEERKGKASYRERQQQLVDKLMSGAGETGQVAGGMKPTITMGPSGPSVSYRSDVMSPAAFEQQRQLAGVRAGESIAKEKAIIDYKKSLPPNMPAKDIEAVTAGKTLLDLMGNAQEAIASIPKGMSESDLSNQAFNYQMRADNPLLATGLKGKTGGLVSFDSDPRLDPYFSWVGQVGSALTTFNLAGMRGGYQTLKYLRAHFPSYADSPEAAFRKVQALQKDSAVVQKRIQEIQDFFVQKGKMLEAPGAIPHPEGEKGGAGVAWMGRPYVTKSGVKRFVWMNPDTGETKDMAEGEMPQVQDLGTQ